MRSDEPAVPVEPPEIDHGDVGEPAASPDPSSLSAPAPELSGAEWKPTPDRGGLIYATMANPKLCLHTTETLGLPSYANPPHFTVDITGTSGLGKGKLWQHVETAKGAYALRSPGRPNSPNADAGPVTQVEMIAYARDAPTWNDETYEIIARICAFAIEEWDVPFVFAPGGFVGSEGYGENGAVRMGWDTFKAFSGIHAHQHVTHNSHWDAGNIDEAKLKAKIEELLDGDVQPSPAEITLQITRKGIKQGAKDSGYGGDVYIAQGLLAAHGYDIGIDGEFGPKTDNQVRAFQKANGLKDDGIIGEKTWAALEA